jgi:2'-5' RNA ligase
VVRAFVAVPVEEAVVRRRLLGARSLLPELQGLRWTPAPQLHFTLKFLGEIEESRVEAAKRATAAAARGAPAFALALEGLGAFPPRGPSRVLWAGCGAGAGELVRLAAAVEAAFAAEGFAPEARPFSAHLTLARVKDPDAGRRLARALPQVPAEPFGTVAASSLVLFRSELTPRGADHEELLRVALESPAAPQ